MQFHHGIGLFCSTFCEHLRRIGKIAIIAISLTLSTKIGKSIAKGIASPLGKLGKRLKTSRRDP